MAWSAVLLGDRASALDVLERTAVGDAPRRWTALEAAIRSMGVEHGARFIQGLNRVWSCERKSLPLAIWAIQREFTG